jgi:uncharacterized phage protein (TIGR02220 family)
VIARLRDGVDEFELRAVIQYCANELGWLESDELRENLRPSTLFAAQKIGKYLDAARARYAKQIAEARLNGAAT